MSDDVFKGNTTFTLPGFSGGEVTDQGDRGTCVAVSVINALEYAASSGEKFSPQFLYACCKAQAGSAMETGLTLQNAFSCVQQYGIALNSDCPYNAAQIADEAQISAERLKEVKTRSFGHPLKMLLTPQNVNEYKMILSGAAGMKPVPVVTGIRFFDNLLPDGTLNVPGAFDHEIQAHAVLIYGWKDTPDDSLSRGYFLARNSWGKIPVLKISYEYMTQFAMEAGYTAVPLLAETVAVTEKETKTEMNVQENQYKMIDHKALAAENEYFGLQKQNMLSESFSFPDIRSPFPFWEKVACNVPQNAFTSSLGDAPVSFAEFLEQRQVAHLKCNKVKVYNITAKPGKHYNFISTFLIRTDGKQLTAGDLGLFYEYMETYGPNDKPLHTFMTIGGYPGFDATCLPLATPTVILCERKELQLLLMDEPYSIWQVKSPDAPWNMFTYEFVLHLLPNSYNGVIKMLLDRWPDHLPATVSEIKKKLLLPPRRGDIHDKIIEAELDKIFLVEYPKYGKNKHGEVVNRDKTMQKVKPRRRFIKTAKQLKYEYVTCCFLRLACASLIPLATIAVLDALAGKASSSVEYEFSVKFMREALDNYINSFGGMLRFFVSMTGKLLALMIVWYLEESSIRKRLKLEYNIN